MKKRKRLQLLLAASVAASAILILSKGTARNPVIEPLDIQETPADDSRLIYKEKSQPSEPQWHSYTTKSGDNFSTISAVHLGLTPAEAISITHIANNKVNLSQVKPGQTFHYLKDNDGTLLILKIPITVNQDFFVTRSGNDFTAELLEKPITRVHQVYKGQVTNSLGGSMTHQGIPVRLVTQACALLEKQNNLRKDLRSGDQFDMLIASDAVDGNLYSSKIKAVRINGKRIQTALYLHSDGFYYDAIGQGLALGFIREPLKTSFPISSSFNLERKHPITNKVRPHYGTDFATPIGTSVVAPAKGTVKEAGYQMFSGHYLVLEHSNGYLTRYFHLSKIMIKEGSTVDLGDEIALTGNSGRSTGPHLHYELHKDGHPVDAMIADIPIHRHLTNKDLALFQEQVTQCVATLNKNDDKLLVASKIKSIKPKS